MKTLRIGSRGAVVRSLQLWYNNFFPCKVDGQFGPKTAQVTRKVQRHFGIKADGIVGPRSAGRFMIEGWLPATFEQPSETLAPYPKPPTKYAPLAQGRKIQRFGSPGTTPANPKLGGAIRRDPAFSKSIVRVNLKDWFPHISGVSKLELNAAVELQWRRFFDAIVTKNLGLRLISCAGSWNPRFVRGSTTFFSSHAFATAVDFNAPENWLGAQPAKKGEPGSLVEIIPLAKRYKIWWGGWFRRVDGMHFESTATDAQLGLI